MHVYISYHDSGNSSLIHVQRSDDDGATWHRVGDPIVGQGRTTGNATFNNDQGPLKTDAGTHNVYDIYAAGEAGIQKATTATFNNIFVSNSTDNLFEVALDPANGKAAVIYTDDTLTTDSMGNPLPQIVLAQQN